MNIGLFGGTFDPPHYGHLIVAQDALTVLGLDRILFVPAARPPHKLGLPVTAAADRAKMLELAIAGDERFGVDLLELERTGPSYTVDTLRALSRRQPGTVWTLLLGADQYAEFGTWREPSEIRQLARIAVLSRGGATAGASAAAAPEAGSAEASTAERAAGADTGHAVGTDMGHAVAAGAGRPSSDVAGTLAVAVTRIDISATAIRQRVAAGRPIRYLVPDAVAAFIFERQLYGRNGTTVAG